MRYLRMLMNAAAGGVMVATYLVVLVLQLNPHVPVVSDMALRWLGLLVAFYGPYLTAGIFLLLLVREALASTPLSPAWLSVRVLGWLGAVVAGAASIVTWANLRSFEATLTVAAAERMRQGAIATTVLAVVLLTVVVLRYSFGQRGSRLTAVLLIVSLLSSVGVPLWLRGPVEPPVPVPQRLLRTRIPVPPPRVRLILLDGGSLGFIRQRVAAGQLPHLGNILDRGAVIDLATLTPTQAEPVWTAAATGKYPPRTGVRSDALYRTRPDEIDPVDLLPDYCFAYALVYQGFVEAQPVTADAVRSRPLWDILADYGLASGIVGWPLTYPARAERGYVVSDRFDEAASSPLRLFDARAGDPTTAVDLARQTFDAWQNGSWRDVFPAASPTGAPPPEYLSAIWDHAYSESADRLEQQFAPRLMAVRYEGLDAIGHRYLRDAQPERFGEVRADERSLLDQYYAFIDAEVGRAVDRLRTGDLLLVVSGFGMEPVSLPKRWLARLLGQPELSGTHEPAPDGFLLAYGANVAAGQFSRGAIVDLAPTVLYYMGLDVGRDMDGFARTDLFLRSFTRDRPVSYVLTHDR